ncbi:elongation factor Ts [Candidatus Parcubacteria bacterium]|nr:elongation factor Ts [Candidatus Parcubacteria bacterium]
MVTTEQIKQLRDQTGISVMQCKKALEEAGGDMEKALVILRAKSKEAASKKSDRALGAGVVASYVHSNSLVGSLVELACETDFVAKNDEFKALAYEIAMHVTAASPEYLDSSAVPSAAKEKVKETFADEVKSKPENIREKIMEGKLAAYFGEMTLLDQPFIKNPDLTVKGLIDAAVQKFGEKIAVVRFSRFQVGK